MKPNESKARRGGVVLNSASLPFSALRTGPACFVKLKTAAAVTQFPSPAGILVVDEPRDAGLTAGDPVVLVSSKGSRIWNCNRKVCTGKYMRYELDICQCTCGLNRWESYVTENADGALRRTRLFLHRP